MRSSTSVGPDWVQRLTSLAGIVVVAMASAALLYASQANREQASLTEQGRVTDRFTRAVEQLCSNGLDIRLGGIFALERIMHDSSIEPAVIEVLAAFLRDHAPQPDNVTEPAADIQAALTVLGRRPDPHRSGRGPIDLSGADLNGTALTGGNLTGAYLTRTHLEGTDLNGTDLTGANLAGADLEGAILAHANLTGADLAGADLEGADLHFATNLTGADLDHADMEGTNLARVTLPSADLAGADLEGADLAHANLTGADLTGADLTGANLTGTHVDSHTILDRTDLAGADLAGANLARPLGRLSAGDGSTLVPEETGLAQ